MILPDLKQLSTSNGLQYNANMVKSNENKWDWNLQN